MSRDNWAAANAARWNFLKICVIAAAAAEFAVFSNPDPGRIQGLSGSSSSRRTHFPELCACAVRKLAVF